MNEFYKKKIRRRAFVTTAINSERVKTMEDWWEEIFTDNRHVEERWTTRSPKPINPDEIAEIIAWLPNKKATGWDEIPNELIKYGGPNMLRMICTFINKCWSEQTIPKRLKDVMIYMLYKKGDTSVCDNFRPIALNNTLLRIYDKVLLNKWLNVLDAGHG